MIREVESTLTDRYRTTVPEPGRRALKLGWRDRIRFTIRDDGEAVLLRAVLGEGDDRNVGPFLDLLAGDLAAHSERIAALGGNLRDHIRSLRAGV